MLNYTCLYLFLIIVTDLSYALKVLGYVIVVLMWELKSVTYFVCKCTTFHCVM